MVLPALGHEHSVRRVPNASLGVPERRPSRSVVQHNQPLHLPRFCHRQQSLTFLHHALVRRIAILAHDGHVVHGVVWFWMTRARASSTKSAVRIATVSTLREPVMMGASSATSLSTSSPVWRRYGITSRCIETSSVSCSSGRVVRLLRDDTLASECFDDGRVHGAARARLCFGAVHHPVAALLVGEVHPQALRDVDLPERAAYLLVGHERDHGDLVQAEERHLVDHGLPLVELVRGVSRHGAVPLDGGLTVAGDEVAAVARLQMDEVLALVRRRVIGLLAARGTLKRGRRFHSVTSRSSNCGMAAALMMTLPMLSGGAAPFSAAFAFRMPTAMAAASLRAAGASELFFHADFATRYARSASNCPSSSSMRW